MKKRFNTQFLYKYPANADVKLEFDKILSKIEAHCFGPLGVRFLKSTRIYTEFEKIRTRLQQVDEFKRIIERDEAFPADHYIELNAHLQLLNIENSALSIEQMLEVRNFSRTAFLVYTFLSSKREDYPELHKLVQNDPFDEAVSDEIDRVLTPDGQVRPGVSPDLEKIRKSLSSLEHELDRKFNRLLADVRKSGYLGEGEESIKNGRRVLSLLSEHKRKVKGVIHDESSSGRIVYVEPEAIMEMSNDIFELKLQERREIYRILRELSQRIRPYVPQLHTYQGILGIVDFVRAKAIFALEINGNMVQLHNEPLIELVEARHPLLFLLHKNSGKPTVPLNLKLDKETRILVISGPNAGGKSVSLKTVGLLQMMLQSGILIPAKETSQAGIFKKLFVDIGDEQSLENDLSTYSSHLLHMKNFLEKSNSESLILIDEFGTGTDPQFGGAMAEAILEQLNRKKVFGLVTTHYSNLKIFAENRPGLLNGSMIFDHTTLSSTYELMSGKAGSSYAFEIAKKIGLSDKVINKARSKAGTDIRTYDELLTSLEHEKQVYMQRDQRVKQKEEHLQGLMTAYENLKRELEENRQRLELEAKEQAMQQIKETNRKMENMIRELREQEKSAAKAAKSSGEETASEKAIQRKKEVEQLKDKAGKELSELRKNKKSSQKYFEIEVGDKVRFSDSKETGVVEEFRGKKAVVSFGSLRTVVDRAELVPVQKAAAEKKFTKSTGYDYAKVASETNPELDLRGIRREEAMQAVEELLDKALLLNYNRLRILHGKGNGILRKSIREMLGKYSFVKDFYSEHVEHGGDGITIVELG